MFKNILSIVLTVIISYALISICVTSMIDTRKKLIARKKAKELAKNGIGLSEGGGADAEKKPD